MWNDGDGDRKEGGGDEEEEGVDFGLATLVHISGNLDRTPSQGADALVAVVLQPMMSASLSTLKASETAIAMEKEGQ